MAASIVLALSIGVVVMFLSWYITFRQRRQRMYELADKLPGLTQLPIIGHVHRFAGDTEDVITTLQEISKLAINEGGIAKFWIGHILFCMITDPADIEYVAKTFLDKDEITRFFRKLAGNGVAFAPVSIWRHRRKIMTPGFSPKHLDSFFNLFCKKSELLSDKLNSKVGAGAFDLWPFISSYSLDSIFETILGTNAKAKSGDYEKLLYSMGELLRLVSKRLFQPWLHPDWLYGLTPSYSIYKKCFDFAYSYTDDVVNSTKQHLQEEKLNNNDGDELKEWKSFLSFLITQSSKSQAYSDVELREEAIALALAGTDTSSVGSCFTLLLLARHQDVQDKVYQELVDVFGASDRPLVKEDLPKLCYLERVIKESLRLYPPAPFISRQADREIMLPSGKVLPAGCGIPISIWGVHRNPKYWGEDAEQFQPDRFSPEHYNPQHPCVYMPFSAGPRNCLGYRYAMMSMKVLLATVLRKYRVIAPDGNCSSQIKVKFEVMMKAAGGYNVIVENRAP